MLKPNFEKADGLGMSIHKKLSMLKKIEYAQTKF